MIYSDLFFWKSKLQNSVVLSSFEAEYIALSECTRELVSLFNFLNVIIVNLPTPSSSCDNAACTLVVENSDISKRSKHIDVIYHYSLEKVHDGFINVKHVLVIKILRICLQNPLLKSFFRDLFLWIKIMFSKFITMRWCVILCIVIN
jgi:hypothetical protein